MEVGTSVSGGRRPGRREWLLVVVLFLIGLWCRTIVFSRPHLEGDERIYLALVQQLEVGRGLTLQGHPLLEESWVARDNYSQKVFFHPPGGIGLFWIFTQWFGPSGPSVVQVASYVVFFWAMIGLAALVFAPISAWQALATAALAAFTPIMTHVVSRHWLDGPLLAFSTAAAAIFLLAVRRESVAMACAAGALLGYAGLVKSTAILVVPGVVALGFAVRPSVPWRKLLLLAACLLAVAGCLVGPWVVYQWSVAGGQMAVPLGRPAPYLLEINPYVRYVTLCSPWIYLSLIWRSLWTLVPSVLLFGLLARRREVGLVGGVLLGWIGLILGVNIALGFAGFSKLLRYVILLTPATILLFGLVTGAARTGLEKGEMGGASRTLARILLALAFVGLALEVVQGVKTVFLDNGDLIMPLFGGR